MISSLTQDQTETLLSALLTEGFALAGAVDLELLDDSWFQALERYDRWIEGGYQDTMEYLVRGRARRADPSILLPGVQAIVPVALPYPTAPAGAEAPSEGPRYARYLQGPDYHKEITRKLETVAAATLPPGVQWRACVDTSAVMERTWAALAGLGWIGKNGMLIHPRLGSHLFLGELLITARTGRGPAPLADLCGHCRRCLDGCPTKAFVAEGRVDARRCISGLTLERRGDLAASSELKKAMGTWIAGCDVCQEVCPFNRKREKAESGASLGSHGAVSLVHWEELLRETSEGYGARIKGSALSRIKWPDFQRNLANALLNAGVESDDVLALVRERAGDSVVGHLWSECLASMERRTSDLILEADSDQLHRHP